MSSQCFLSFTNRIYIVYSNIYPSKLSKPLENRMMAPLPLNFPKVIGMPMLPVEESLSCSSV